MKHNGRLFLFFFFFLAILIFFFFSGPHIHIPLLSFLILFSHSTFLSFPLLCLILFFRISSSLSQMPFIIACGLLCYKNSCPYRCSWSWSLVFQVQHGRAVFPSTSECLRLLYYDYLLHFSDCHYAFWHLTVCMPLPFRFDACHRRLPSCYVPVQSHPGLFHSMAASQIKSPLRGVWASSRLCFSTSILHKPSLLLVLRMFPTP